MKAKKQMCPPIESELAKEFFFKGDKRGVLLIHGFTGTPSHMRPLGEALQKEGYTVLGVQLPGHGTTIEAMELCRWTDWLKGTRDAFHRLAKDCDNIFVAGLSMGGLLTLILAEEMPIQAAVTISSPIRLQNWKAYFSFIIKYFKRYQSWPKNHDSKPNEYNVGYAATPIRKLPDLIRLIRMAERGLDRITCPLLIIQPSHDDTVRLDSPEIIYTRAIHCANKSILRLEHSKHVCTIEPEFSILYSSISTLFKEAMGQL